MYRQSQLSLGEVFFFSNFHTNSDLMHMFVSLGSCWKPLWLIQECYEIRHMSWIFQNIRNPIQSSSTFVAANSSFDKGPLCTWFSSSWSIYLALAFCYMHKFKSNPPTYHSFIARSSSIYRLSYMDYTNN